MKRKKKKLDYMGHERRKVKRRVGENAAGGENKRNSTRRKGEEEKAIV
jgi:hypothetical protein